MPEAHQLLNDTVRISYTVEGQGDPILLHHGFTSSAAAWREFGYNDDLVRGYTVINLDARGHGQSDKPHDPGAYTMDLCCEDVRLVCEAAGVERIHFWGYSMGGRTAYGFWQRYPEMVRSLIVGGASPFVSPDQAESYRRWAAALSRGDVAEFAALIGAREKYVRQVVEANDAQALAASQLGLLGWPGLDPATITVPALFYGGSEDPLLPGVERAATAAPNARLEILEGLNHLSAFGQSDRVLPIVREFLAGV
ncbi:MAG: alpha/beta fold hydrolase [Dehalococcoidia bacterium]